MNLETWIDNGDSNQTIRYKQLKLLIAQEGGKIPITDSKIRCVCNNLVFLVASYRCFHCGVWLCESCAEKHFKLEKDKHN